MGCGKSSIGKKIANYLNWKFVDMDDLIEGRTQLTVSEIFESKGEYWFRKLERDILQEFKSENNIIVATGGGVPCFEDNMERMSILGNTIYLKVSPENLFVRLKRGRDNRPKIKNLNDQQLLSFIENTLEQRDKAYTKASLLIDCDGVTEAYIADHIEKYLKHNM